MEQTIGKRIMENRKQLGLTQDALAEQLGVTAQAVSKWENDQSCPDITMLPRLAEIFGITIDELLGHRTDAKVHQAEVIREEEPENEGFHINNGTWELKWDGGKRSAVAFAVLVLLVGSLCFTSALLKWDIGFWSILWPSALLVFGISELFKKFSFFCLGCGLFGGYFLLKNLGILQLDIGGELIFPIIIVLFGLSLLVDALRKPKRGRFRVTRDGMKISDENNSPKKGKNEYTTDSESFNCNCTFCEDTQVVNLPLLSEGNIILSFGELTIDLTGCEEITDGCALYANCSFGELEILVPKRCRVVPESNTTFASMSVEGEPDPYPTATMYIEGNITFGEITIKYI